MAKEEQKMTPEKRNSRGGVRAGAGRPKGSSKLYAFRADAQVAAFIDGKVNKTEFIRDCIQAEMSRQQAFVKGVGVPIQATELPPLTLPFFDVKVVAGFPIPLDSDERAQGIEILQMLCPHPESSYLIRVKGDSMIQAGVSDGDILIVDKSCRQPSERQIAVCELNGEYTVKRVMEREGRMWLVPANPNYPEIEVTEADNFSVWGVVTFVIHRPQ